MSTRGAYVFEDDSNGVSVYRHSDNYPSGAAEAINNALKKSWILPRYEPDEFAAAFVAANKDGPGGIRLIGGDKNEWKNFAHDLEYVYNITSKDGKLHIIAWSVYYLGKEEGWKMKQIYEGELEGLADAKEDEDEQ